MKEKRIVKARSLVKDAFVAPIVAVLVLGIVAVILFYIINPIDPEVYWIMVCIFSFLYPIVGLLSKLLKVTFLALLGREMSTEVDINPKAAVEAGTASRITHFVYHMSCAVDQYEKNSDHSLTWNDGLRVLYNKLLEISEDGVAETELRALRRKLMARAKTYSEPSGSSDKEIDLVAESRVIASLIYDFREYTKKLVV